MEKPIIPKPMSIIAQVAGSGTAAIASVRVKVRKFRSKFDKLEKFELL
jgi:hypothetical protein